MHRVCCLTAENKMSAVSAALVLVILGMSVNCSGAIRCYTCGSDFGGLCDDPLDTGRIPVKVCPPNYSACWRGRGWGDSKNCKNFLIECLHKLGIWHFVFVDVIVASVHKFLPRCIESRRGLAKRILSVRLSFCQTREL